MGHLTGILHRDSHPRLWMTMGKAVSEKSDRTTWHSKWIPQLEKFSKKSLQAFSSWNRMWRGVESEEDVLEWRGFQDGVDLRLDAICSLSEREREREREREKQKNIITIEYQQKKRKKGTYAWRMHEHVTC